MPGALVQQIDGVPARFALVLSSCWALLLVVFTATDHLCFIMPLRFIRVCYCGAFVG